MRLLAAIVTLLSISLPSIVAAQTDYDICVIQGINRDPDDPWYEFRDPNIPRNQNCWWPVERGNSVFHIKTTDNGRGVSNGWYMSPEGWRGTMPKEVWVLGLHANDPSVRYRRSMSLYRFSCFGDVRRFALIKFTAFSASGEILEDRETPDASWRIAIPDTKEQSLAGFVCANDVSLAF